MGQTVSITITTGNEALATIENAFLKSTSMPKEEMNSVINYLSGAAGGEYQCSMDVIVNGGTGVAASGTITFSNVSTANDTVLINGVTFTCVASGATGNQWNVAASAILQAAALASAINGSATALVNTQVTAANSGTAVCTITSKFETVAGNAVTIAEGVDAGSVMTVSGARLTGGANPAANLYHYGL